MRWVGCVARTGERRGMYMELVRKPEGQRPLGKRRCRWENNIKIYLRDAGCGGMDRIELAQDREMWRVLVTTVMNFF